MIVDGQTTFASTATAVKAARRGATARDCLTGFIDF
jgi:hypothetical protein